MEIRKIQFDEPSHRYTDELNTCYTSVTQKIQQYEPVYDSQFWSCYRAIDKAGIFKPRPFLESREIEINYLGSRQRFPIDFILSGALPIPINNEEILSDWEEVKIESCLWGTNKHAFLENATNSITGTGKYEMNSILQDRETFNCSFIVHNKQELEESPLKDSYPVIYELYEKLINNNWIIFAEKRVYSAQHKIAGTMDIFALKGDEFIIIDWKTNKKALKFESGYYKKVWNSERTHKVETDEFVQTKDVFKYPIHDLPYCKGNVYSLQLSLYALLCELWGFKLKSIRLVHIRPKLDAIGNPILDKANNRIEHEPEIYKMPYLREHAFKLLNH